MEAFSSPAVLALASSGFGCSANERVAEAFDGARDGDPEAVARDESRWFEVQQAFTVDRSQINLNNGGVSPAPRSVQEAHKRRLDFSNENPSRNLWEILEPQKEYVRAALAELFGCDTEEMAITRNTSESIETCLFGWELERGDEILTSDQDYPRNQTTLDSRARRDGLVIRRISLPVPCEDAGEIVRRFEAGITERTKLLLISHVINITGQIVPVRQIVEMARKRGIPVIVDGAHAFANLVYTRDELGCDYYGTSLHKWLFAPHGTGFLYVRRESIEPLWPLMAADQKLDRDIRKFEEIGTHAAAHILSIGEALVFHHGIGPRNKEARMRYLRDRWALRLTENARVRLNTSLKREYGCGVASFRIEGVDMSKMRAHLWARHRIWTTYIGPPSPPECEGLRITPSVYTTLEELDRFCDAIELVLERGLPA